MKLYRTVQHGADHSEEAVAASDLHDQFRRKFFDVLLEVPRENDRRVPNDRPRTQSLENKLSLL